MDCEAFYQVLELMSTQNVASELFITNCYKGKFGNVRVSRIRIFVF